MLLYSDSVLSEPPACRRGPTDKGGGEYRNAGDEGWPGADEAEDAEDDEREDYCPYEAHREQAHIEKIGGGVGALSSYGDAGSSSEKFSKLLLNIVGESNLVDFCEGKKK